MGKTTDTFLWLKNPAAANLIIKVNAGVSGQTFVYPLKIAFYLSEYATN